MINISSNKVIIFYGKEEIIFYLQLERPNGIIHVSNIKSMLELAAKQIFLSVYTLRARWKTVLFKQ